MLQDFASADLSIVCLLISLFMIMNYEIATADVKVQSGLIKWQLYFCLPKQVVHHTTLWNPSQLAKSIVEAACKLFCAVQHFLNFGL